MICANCDCEQYVESADRSELSADCSNSSNGYWILYKFFIRWLGRPKPSIYSWTNEIIPITFVPKDERKEPYQIRTNFVFLVVQNKGRRDLREPQILAPIFPRKLTTIERAFYNFDAYSFNKEALQLEFERIEERQKPISDENKYNDERAYLLINNGLKRLKTIAPKTNGRKIVFGFAFENSDTFYLATDESIKQKPFDLKEGKIQYAHFRIIDASSTSKITGNNIPVKLDAWNKVEFPTLWKYPST